MSFSLCINSTNLMKPNIKPQLKSYNSFLTIHNMIVINIITYNLFLNILILPNDFLLYYIKSKRFVKRLPPITQPALTILFNLQSWKPKFR